MFRKTHDRMFRKVQMKLFSMIVSILLAVFIALIGSINVIFKSVMRGQSKVVLMQIASGIEYNDKTSEFTFTPPENSRNKTEKHTDAPTTRQTTSATVTTTTKTTADTTSSTTTEAVTETEAPTDEEYQETENYPENTEQQYEAPETNPDPPTDAPRTEGQPQEIPTEAPTWPTWPTWPEWPQDPNNGNQGGEYNPWADPWANPWYNPWLNPWSQWGYNGENGTPKSYSDEPPEPSTEFDHKRYSEEHSPYIESENPDAQQQFYGDGSPALVQTVYAGEPILDGFTVLSGSTKTPSKKSAAAPMREEAVPKTLGSIDFFVVMADRDGRYLATLYNDELGSGKAQSYITAILNEDLDTGMLNSYQFYQTEKPNGTIIVFTDKSYEMDMLRQLKRTTIIIGSVALVILSVLAYFLSKKSIQPIKTAFNKQKQFVSDASHELKTPLTVISANTDVLEGEIGENRWLTYIKSQTERMSVLVNDLLNLTRLENNSSELERKYFNMSKAIVNTALPFECQAFESNKKFEVNVDDNIMLCGSEKHIRQMTAIFIDNALKYSNDGGTVKVSLRKIGDKKVLSVYNTGEGIKENESDKIFERFYRSDESRNRATGGYGLGLAIAKSIIDKHKFKVHVMNQPGKSICFMVSM